MNTLDDVDDIEPRLDAHIRRTLREVAHRIPSAPVEDRPLSVSVARGWRDHRWYLSAAVVTVVAALVAAVVVTTRDSGDAPEVETATESGDGGPQRLVFDSWPGELLRDGSVVELPVEGVDPYALHGSVQALPDGRHVAVGARDDMPQPVEGFNEFTDMIYTLVVVGAGGEVEIERDLPRSGAEDVDLVAATADEAILARTPRDASGETTGPSRLVAHDLETGRERAIVDDVSVVAAAAANDMVAIAEAPATSSRSTPGFADSATVGNLCRLDVVDLTSSDGGPREVAEKLCAQPRSVRLSPGGDLLAFVYVPVGDPAAPTELRLAIVDVDRQAIRSDEVLGCLGSAACPPGERPVEYLGMAWDDDTDFRVAFVDRAANPDWDPEGEALTEDDILVEAHTVE